MKFTKLAIAPLVALLLAGCGSNSNDSASNQLDLPNGKTLIFFDNESSNQYIYNTDTEAYENMNADATQNYNMTDKKGKLIVWSGVDQKIIMLNDNFNINEGNLTSADFHYLGHLHTEDEKKVFAAHSNSEFDEATSSDAKKTTIKALNMHLLEQEEIKQEIAEALPSSEELCNFFVFDHDHADDSNTTETIPHIAVSKSGQVYVFKEDASGLSKTQSAFSLDGVTACEEDKLSIIGNSEHGVLIFSAESQKLYLVDNHGMDFHQHSSWTASKFLPTGFTPTQLAGIGEGEEDHDHD